MTMQTGLAENSKYPARRWLQFLPALALMILIAVLSHNTLPVDLPEQSDKGLHFLAFATLASLWVIALGTKPGALAGCFLFSSLWGILDEWHQSFVPGRYASIGDVAADVLGALVLVLIVGLIARLRSRRVERT